MRRGWGGDSRNPRLLQESAQVRKGSKSVNVVPSRDIAYYSGTAKETVVKEESPLKQALITWSLTALSANYFIFSPSGIVSEFRGSEYNVTR